MMNGRTYGNSSMGYGYSPDRSYDVDRFNPSTRGNYSTSYNTNGYGCSNNFWQNSKKSTGRYLGNGQYVED